MRRRPVETKGVHYHLGKQFMHCYRRQDLTSPAFSLMFDENHAARVRMTCSGGHAALLTQACGTTRDRQEWKAFVFPSTKGEEPRGTLRCVGTGANRA